ncbi:TetR/AcrR family transcriptional regulator [Ruminococcus sp. XPD3002]|uniref:TetR/AcrR family transcriptional regulator n=1 Tax=Ruminococcus sp. XPD3002 TaxID=1452269 RepID=UPI00090F77BD|nr:transcriptional regulator, TetR family [Ruminococcus flavefaciens]
MQVKKDEIRNKILEMAQRLFIKRGYENTSLKQIAEKSNISKSNIYRYYSSKEDIYEVLTGTARSEIMEISRHFFTADFIGKYTPDKCGEVSSILAKMFSRHHAAMLIMLRSSAGADRKLIEELIIKKFIDACPLDDENTKKLISKLLLFGLIEILVNNSGEKSMEKELNALICYHYLGLNGVKKRYGG